MQQLTKSINLHPLEGTEMLIWNGKKKLEHIETLDAKLCEIYKDSSESVLFHQLFYGDNLDVLRHLLGDYRAKIQLIYIDPPFESQSFYQKKILLKGEANKTSTPIMQEVQYDDFWTSEVYLQFMYERLVLLRELLAENGSIYVHCDWHKVHHLRILMDEIFGAENFRNEIIWKRGTVKGAKAKGKQFARNHDSILYYSKSEKFTFNRQYLPFEKDYLKRFNKDDGDGLGPYRDDQAIGTRSQKSITQMRASGKVFEVNGKLRIKTYLKDLPGVAVDDNWTDIADVNVMSKARTFYPTQKPEELLARIIKTSSNEGDVVLDCFMGSGTTGAVCAKLNRQFIGADNNMGALQTTIKRLVALNAPTNVLTVNESLPKYHGCFTVEMDKINNQLRILDFKPQQLLAKLHEVSASYEHWLELVEAVKIDWHYNGIFQPCEIAFAERGRFVKSTFQMPGEPLDIVGVQILDILGTTYELLITSE